MVTDFWRESAKIVIPHLHSVLWHSTAYAIWEDLNTVDDPSTGLIKIW